MSILTRVFPDLFSETKGRTERKERDREMLRDTEEEVKVGEDGRAKRKGRKFATQSRHHKLTNQAVLSIMM